MQNKPLPVFARSMKFVTCSRVVRGVHTIMFPKLGSVPAFENTVSAVRKVSSFRWFVG